MAKKHMTIDEQLIRHSRWAKLVSLVLIGSAIAAYVCSLNAYGDPFHNFPTDNVNYAVQNLGIVFIFVEAVMALTLKNLHSGLYWFFWLQFKNIKPTEEEQLMRERVFTRTYGYAIFVAIAGFMTGFSIAQYDSFAKNDLYPRLVWIIIILLLALPSVIASWPKRKLSK